MVRCCLPSLHLQNRARTTPRKLTCGGLEDLEVECGDDGSGHIVVDLLLGLHHRCQVQQRDDSNDLLGVPSDLKSSQDGAEGRGVAEVPPSVVWRGS